MNGRLITNHKKMALKNYLKTTASCNIISIDKTAEDESGDYTQYVCYVESDFKRIDILLSRLKSLIADYWKTNGPTFTPDHTYWWLTTCYPSQLKTLHVKSGIIKKLEDTKSQEMNYFDTKEKADKLLELVEDLFKSKGFPLQ